MEFILDYSKWRCGLSSEENSLGEGDTLLCNAQGFMCCLGQFSLQVDKTLKQEDLLCVGMPSSLYRPIEGFSSQGEQGSASTPLAASAVTINDDRDTTPQQKIKLLKTLFEKEGHTIQIINQPKN